MLDGQDDAQAGEVRNHSPHGGSDAVDPDETGGPAADRNRRSAPAGFGTEPA